MLNRDLVRNLQQAHADHIESGYRHLMSLPGNPYQVEIHTIGRTRVFLCNQERLENRAIFTGNESEEAFHAVTELFDKKGVKGFFELNPANFYRTEPFSWKSEVLPTLLRMGYFPSAFRCVWYLPRIEDLVDRVRPTPCIRGFSTWEAAELVDLRMQVEPALREDAMAERELRLNSLAPDWKHFIGYEGEKPVSTSTLYIGGKCGYLSWGFTQEPYRRRGHHGAHIVKRVQDAFEQGCTTVLSVTDFNISSSLSLQKRGFQLAYNYLLLEWPGPAEGNLNK